MDKRLYELALHCVNHTAPANFSNENVEDALRGELQKILLSSEFCTMPNMMAKYSEIISRIMEVARVNHSKIVAKG